MEKSPLSLIFAIIFLFLALVSLVFESILINMLASKYGMEIDLMINAGFYEYPSGDPLMDLLLLYKSIPLSLIVIFTIAAVISGIYYYRKYHYNKR